MSVSIVMPFRNAAATLPECIASIHAQTHRDFEVVAIDDRSSDESAELCRRAGFRVIEAHGLVNALNAGMEAARGELIARMDADDVMHPERLEAQVAMMRDHDVVATQVELFPDHEIRAGYREYIRWQNAVITPEEIAANLFVESPLAHPSVMMRRGLAYADGPFPEDYELWLRLHARGARMAKVPRVLLRWRESASRTSRIDPGTRATHSTASARGISLRFCHPLSSSGAQVNLRDAACGFSVECRSRGSTSIRARSGRRCMARLCIRTSGSAITAHSC